MTRSNLILALCIVVCALGVVASQHKARKLYVELEREQEHMRRVETEWGQLQLEQSTKGNHRLVEKVAREKLQMVAPASGSVMVLDDRIAGDKR